MTSGEYVMMMWDSGGSHPCEDRARHDWAVTRYKSLLETCEAHKAREGNEIFSWSVIAHTCAGSPHRSLSQNLGIPVTCGFLYL